jgi:phosphatidate cytidylyltransferase
LISAAVILSVVLVLLWLDFRHHFGRPGVWLLPLALLLTALAAGELLDLLKANSSGPVAWSVYGGTLAIVLAAFAPLLWTSYPANFPLSKTAWPMSALAFGVLLAFFAEMRRYKRPGGVTVNLALAIFIMSYVGLLMGFMVELRLLNDNARGMAALLSLMIVVKFADVGAYASGRLFGRHKLSPRISPGKTIEGALGGVITACIVSWLVFALLVPRIVGSSQADATSWRVAWTSMVYGVLMAAAGLLGDLAESLLKRDVGRKDSSTWLPGLGGVLDIIDSALAAAPVAYLCWVSGLVGPAVASGPG